MAVCKRLVGNFFIVPVGKAENNSCYCVKFWDWQRCLVCSQSPDWECAALIVHGEKGNSWKTCSCLPNYMQPFCQERYINCRFFFYFNQQLPDRRRPIEICFWFIACWSRAGFNFICIDIFRFKPALHIQCLCFCFIYCRVFWRRLFFSQSSE